MQTIWVTWQYEGWHQYPGAPTQVLYLKSSHRHMFNVRVELEVNPSQDRELEFHMVRALLMQHFERSIDHHDVGSCESQTQVLHSIIDELYPNRHHIITVSEELECGSTYTSNATPPR